MSAAVLPVDLRARIGPNAITRVAEALQARAGESAAVSVFSRAGLLGHLSQPPQHMVDEADVLSLHKALRATLGTEEAELVAADAGRRTGDYLLAHRIPRLAQIVLKMLPAPLAARALLAAVGKHSWTFAGSGTFAVEFGPPLLLTLRNNPLCRGVSLPEPCCMFYAATFERLFKELVHPLTKVAEISCEACGDDCCRFDVRWP
jgi:divinyl protochlorophyllide a 8-vinyl-reductase